MFEDDSRTSDEADIAALFSASIPEDPNYLYRRAEQELELAQAATHPAVVKAHYRLADHYLETLHTDGKAIETAGA